MAKVKALNETVWERHATEPAVAEWLDNFSPANPPAPDERTHALFLLSNFMYFGSREIRELLKALYRDLYRYPIIERIRKANDDTLNSGVIDPLFREELRATRFLGVGNPSESGSLLLYYFRQENALPTDLFVSAHRVFSRNGASRSLQLREPAVKRYIFIDDLCGTGKQGVAYSRDIVEDIKRLDCDHHVSVAYYILFGTTQGIERVKRETAFDEVMAVYELDSSFKCFSDESRYFQTQISGIDRIFCEEVCRKYGANMMAAPHVLGFEDSQLLIGFFHNTPDNTLPIIWFNEPGGLHWKPIFRRYPKLEW